MPDSPTGLRVYLQGDKTSPRSFCADWNYQDLGFPCQFLIEHRTKLRKELRSDIWTGQKTEKHQLAIPFLGSVLEIRAVSRRSCRGDLYRRQRIQPSCRHGISNRRRQFGRGKRNLFVASSWTSGGIGAPQHRRAPMDSAIKWRFSNVAQRLAR